MKPSTYLETSVIGAYLDNGEPFRRDLTIRWWEHELSEYRAVISPLVTRELERVSEPHRSAYLKLIKDLEQVSYKAESMQIDKDRDRARTHLSDALGYLIWQECRPQPPIGEQNRRLL